MEGLIGGVLLRAHAVGDEQTSKRLSHIQLTSKSCRGSSRLGVKTCVADVEIKMDDS